jgi:hypothetical protein
MIMERIKWFVHATIAIFKRRYFENFQEQTKKNV